MKKALLLLLFITSSLYAQIPIGQPADLLVCDNGNDGVETFNLTTIESEILNGLNPSEYSIDFYNSLSGAETALGAIEFSENYVNITSPEVIYVRVEEIADPTNFEVATFEVIVNPLPFFSIDDVTICEGEMVVLDSGFQTLSDLSFEWRYEDEVIAGATNNQLTVSQAGTFKLLVTSASTGCSYEDSAEVIINLMPQANIIGNTTIAPGEITEVTIAGPPDATIGYTLDFGNGPGSVMPLVLSSTGFYIITLPAFDTYAAVCLTSVTSATTPDCVNTTLNCFTIVVSSADVVTIPDVNFKAKLLSSSTTSSVAKDINGNLMKIDANNDNEIQVTEALLVYALDVMDSSIADLTGISSFTNLKMLICAVNNIAALDVSACANLERLNCTTNLLATLNVTGLSNLKEIACDDNQLTAIDLSGLTSLQVLNCYENDLSSLNISGLNSLAILYCGKNQITSITGNAPLLATLDCRENMLSSLDASIYPMVSLLTCDNNQLSTLNISGLANLSILRCQNNQIGSLDLAGSTNLFEVSCSNNQITTLDFSGLSNLNTIYASSNNLTSVVLTGATSSVYMDFANNDLTSIDLTGLSALTTLNVDDNNLSGFTGLESSVITNISCRNNQITDMDFSIMPQLYYLVVSNNLFTSLDFSQNPVFEHLICDNNPNLTFINLKNDADLSGESADWSDNPNLAFVCVDEGEIVAISQILLDNLLTNVNLNSYCSFIPGGAYNTITGTQIFDGGSNGCDANDLPQPFMKVNINDGTTQGATFTNATGNYTFYTTETGNYTLTPEIENPSFFTISPANIVVNFPVIDDSISTNNFCITPNGNHPDLEIVLVPVVPARPGFLAIYQLVYKNKGNQIISGDVVFTFDGTVLSLVTSTPAPGNQTAGSYTYSYADLLPFEKRVINILFNVNAPTATPAVNIDDVLSFTASVLVPSDETPEDNIFNLDQVVIGSYDPNDKQCIEGDVLAPEEIGGYLHYLIRFENTGTAPAENIVVKDVIDTTMFDVSSLRVMNSSHPVEAKVTGNVAEFIFKNINLETNGHGNILLKVKTNATLSTGAVVKNKADIFFDYNFPIITNEATTLFQNLGIDEYNIDSSISIYPNPSHDIVNIEASSVINSVQVYDIQGRLLMSHLVSDLKATVDISDKANGIYFFKINSDKGIKVEKMIKK